LREARVARADRTKSVHNSRILTKRLLADAARARKNPRGRARTGSFHITLLCESKAAFPMRVCRAKAADEAPRRPPSSGRQRQRPEFLSSRAKAAELIDRRTSRRERERRKRLRQHLVQIRFRSDADRHVRIESLARRVSDEVFYIRDQEVLNVTSAFVAV